MKKFINISAVFLLLSVVFVSCLKDEYPAPKVEGVKFYILNDKDKYEEVTNPVAGTTYFVAIASNADIITIWAGGERSVMKTHDQTTGKETETDSIDINGNQVLKKSNYYSDYGLLRAQGIKTSLNEEIGWIAKYKYPVAGTYTMTIVATNHGYDSDGYDQRTFEFTINMAEPQAAK